MQTVRLQGMQGGESVPVSATCFPTPDDGLLIRCLVAGRVVGNPSVEGAVLGLVPEHQREAFILAEIDAAVAPCGVTELKPKD